MKFKNIFVLCTGRNGSVTFSKACELITNYSSGHETNKYIVGKDRVLYPDFHIEIDNRLSWFLGRLDKEYGNSAFYVHLKREDILVAKSFALRYGHTNSIIKAYRDGILMQEEIEKDDFIEVSKDYVETINTNIELFLKDKKNKIHLTLDDTIKDGFETFWYKINAQGNLDQAKSLFENTFNASVQKVEEDSSTKSNSKIRKLLKVLKF